MGSGFGRSYLCRDDLCRRSPRSRCWNAPDKLGPPVDERGLAARLAAAHGHAIGALPLRHVRRAIESGDKPLALTHLALSGLAKLANPKADARRLFVADALIRSGVDSAIIVKALGPSPETLDKYNSDQPRVAAGNPDGGQWTRGDSVGATPSWSTKEPISVQVADASHTRGREVVNDAASETSASQSESAPAPVAGNDQPVELAQNLDLDQTCAALIAANCKARILRVFPGQYLVCTLREVQAAAREGDAAARSACKLLSRPEYRK